MCECFERVSVCCYLLSARLGRVRRCGVDAGVRGVVVGGVVGDVVVAVVLWRFPMSVDLHSSVKLHYL